MTRDLDEGFFTRRKFKLGFRRWFAEKDGAENLEGGSGVRKKFPDFFMDGRSFSFDRSGHFA